MYSLICILFFEFFLARNLTSIHRIENYFLLNWKGNISLFDVHKAIYKVQKFSFQRVVPTQFLHLWYSFGTLYNKHGTITKSNCKINVPDS